ncbi:hypothetical protein BURMUCF1_0338, partial [Burkholderia multivorans ATCC BAA-247]
MHGVVRTRLYATRRLARGVDRKSCWPGAGTRRAVPGPAAGARCIAGTPTRAPDDQDNPADREKRRLYRPRRRVRPVSRASRIA